MKGGFAMGLLAVAALRQAAPEVLEAGFFAAGAFEGSDRR
jgi:hypothetical protein